MSGNTARVSVDSQDSYRVMIVDDSAVIRGIINKWLSALPDIDVVASCRHGEDALRRLDKIDVDVIILDIEMPIMDGLTALPLILKKAPHVRVLMASTLTRRNADISIRAMTMGASDYVPKPESMTGGVSAGDFQHDLIDKVRALGAAVRGKVLGKTAPAAGGKKAPVAEVLKQPANLALKPASSVPPRIVAIGSSTGGPKALIEMMKSLAPALDGLPVVITQHMPPTFTAILAEHVAAATGRTACEGETGMKLEPGKIYVAPGGFHMLLEKKGADTLIRLDDSPAVNYCRPAVDPMIDSLVAIYGSAILACILTGMGHDGRDACIRLQEAGGTVVAQDEATSVVWGMPGAVAQAGICHQVLPLEKIGLKMSQIIKGAAR